MLQRLSNKQLIVILAFLGLIILAIKYIDFTKSAKEQLQFDQINIDTSRITAIYVYPSNSLEELIFFKDEKDNRWELVKGSDSLGTPITNLALLSVFSELKILKKDSLFGQKDVNVFDLDSNGTGVLVVYDFDKRALEFVIGKSKESKKTLFRVKGENNIYQTESSLYDLLNQSPMTFIQKDNYFPIPYQDWVQFEFKLPSFGDYKMIKKNEKWFLNDSVVSAEKVKAYYAKVEAISDTLECKGRFDTELFNSDFLLIINGSDSIKGVTNGAEVILLNGRTYFKQCSSHQLFENVFVSRSYWTKPE